MARPAQKLSDLLTLVRACRICVERPDGETLPHAPRPVLQASETSRVLIAGQAPGTRVHASGRPFTDPSGDRLRRWLAMDSDLFYDESRVAILPMGFCFPGLDAKGGDRPPRRECAPAWRQAIVSQLNEVRLIVTLGLPAARWHLNLPAARSLLDVLGGWKSYLDRTPPVVVLPHPSWRNNALLRRADWIEGEIVPVLQGLVREALQ